MTRVLVTGGAGTLGREVVKRAVKAGYTVRVMSRGSRRGAIAESVEWTRANAETGQGLEEAVAGVDVIVNCFSSPTKNTYEADVLGTGKLIDQAKAAKVGHFIHVSIVGIERIPFPYYRHKVAAEEVIKTGGIPWTTLRATQFHNLIDGYLLGPISRGPIMPLPLDLQCQSVDPSEVADCLTELIGKAPAGLLPDFGGPEVLTLWDMTPLWLAARGMRRMILPLWLPGKVADGFRRGLNTCPQNRQGKITWVQWLACKYEKGAGK
jgi:uncharacterized protein YbjT (DUF2867 family)